MSKMAIIGAAGHAGSQILEEALHCGRSVTAMVHHASTPPARVGVVTQDIDVLDSRALQQAVAGHDALFGAAHFSGIPARAIIDPVKQAGVKRLLAAGGAASLFVARGLRWFDAQGFPAE